MVCAFDQIQIALLASPHHVCTLQNDQFNSPSTPRHHLLPSVFLLAFFLSPSHNPFLKPSLIFSPSTFPPRSSLPPPSSSDSISLSLSSFFCLSQLSSDYNQFNQFQTMQRRPRTENADSSSSSTTTSSKAGMKRTKKYAMARRGLRSLGIAIAVPLGLTVVTIYLFGTGRKYEGIAKPFWYPPLWVFHFSALSTSCLMSLSAWLVWAEGGFHQHSAALPLFLAQFLLGQMWAPIVFRSGATGAGLAVCILLFLTLYGCSKTFKRINPIAADLVKPCLAWAAFLGLMNFKLL